MLRFWRRQRRPGQTPTAGPRSNPDRIAVLENELLGIVPEPGTSAARAVALSKPVNQKVCPHDDVIDVTELGQARRTGLCRHCGADMVAEDSGAWERP